jgi:hypothetical protein
MEVELTNDQDANHTRETMFLLGGAAMVLFGAGLILSTSAVRRYLGNGHIGNLLQGALPDLQRYLKLRDM